jgi:hypothetical protein
MSALSPTLAGAIAKAERGIAFLRIPQATADHLRNAMDHFKSAANLAASHRTVLVELEAEIPAPGPALFDASGDPAPGAEVADEKWIGLRIEEHPILAMNEAAYCEFNHMKQEALEQEMLFALRLHTRARGLDYEAIRDLVMDDLGGLGHGTFDWLVSQILTSGSFEWLHRCEDCQCADTPDANGQVLCHTCKWKRDDAARKAKVKAEKKQANVATPKKPRSPKKQTVAEFLENEGGDE